MSLQLLRADLTRINCDAIVVPSNTTLLAGGSVFGAALSAAGPGFFDICRSLGGCEVGGAKITKAYNLPCKYVIFTAGPVWKGGSSDEVTLLADCYRNSLDLARKNRCKKIAFGLIDSGIYGYPPDVALETAVDTILEYLEQHEMQIYLVMFDWTAYNDRSGGVHALQAYIERHYVEAPIATALPFSTNDVSDKQTRKAIFPHLKKKHEVFKGLSSTISLSLTDAVNHLDESFSQMLLRKIDESDMTDSECYKKANIDRRLFSKIRSDVHYKPKKTTVIAFAIALELSLDETKEMLMKAGFALSHSSKFDIIIEYFILKGNYNVFDINEALFRFDQPLLGSNE